MVPVGDEKWFSWLVDLRILTFLHVFIDLFGHPLKVPSILYHEITVIEATTIFLIQTKVGD